MFKANPIITHHKLRTIYYAFEYLEPVEFILRSCPYAYTKDNIDTMEKIYTIGAIINILVKDTTSVAEKNFFSFEITNTDFTKLVRLEQKNNHLLVTTPEKLKRINFSGGIFIDYMYSNLETFIISNEIDFNFEDELNTSYEELVELMKQNTIIDMTPIGLELESLEKEIDSIIENTKNFSNDKSELFKEYFLKIKTMTDKYKTDMLTYKVSMENDLKETQDNLEVLLSNIKLDLNIIKDKLCIYLETKEKQFKTQTLKALQVFKDQLNDMSSYLDSYREAKDANTKDIDQYIKDISTLSTAISNSLDDSNRSIESYKIDIENIARIATSIYEKQYKSINILDTSFQEFGNIILNLKKLNENVDTLTETNKYLNKIKSVINKEEIS